MTNKEILRKAIDKAIENGCEIKQSLFDYVMNSDRMDECLDYYIKEEKHFEIIFSHDFAEAFFGNAIEPYDNAGVPYTMYRKTPDDWTYHLQTMVLQKEPLKYLEKFLND